MESADEQASPMHLLAWPDSGQRTLWLRLEGLSVNKPLQIKLLNTLGTVVASQKIVNPGNSDIQFQIPDLPVGIYYCTVYQGNVLLGIGSVSLVK